MRKKMNNALLQRSFFIFLRFILGAEIKFIDQSFQLVIYFPRVQAKIRILLEGHMGKAKIKDIETKFIVCSRYKNIPRKHVEVCRRCRWNGKCGAYQEYLQPYLPLHFFSKTHK